MLRSAADGFLGTAIPLIIFGVVKQVWFDNYTGENGAVPSHPPINPYTVAAGEPALA